MTTICHSDDMGKVTIYGQVPSKSNGYRIITICGHSSLGKTKALKDDNVYAYNPIGNFNTRIYREGSSGFEWTVLTDMSKSKINSKYSTFLSGDAPLVRIINNDLPDAGNVLIIKDSFGNAMAPFFTQNYHTVYVVDYRYYPKSLSNLVGSLGINDIIFLPNISDLQTRAVGDLLQKYKK